MVFWIVPFIIHIIHTSKTNKIPVNFGQVLCLELNRKHKHSNMPTTMLNNLFSLKIDFKLYIFHF